MERVDPNVKLQLQELAKEKGNDRCVDCDSASPQWASPKFGVYICLGCAGVHRSLGVHISFVRSITMDNFKPIELAKMKAGGNDEWRNFFNNYEDNLLEARTFDDCTIKERYDSKAGDEWRERLSAKAEDREFDPSLVAAHRKPSSTSKPQDTLSSTTSPLPAPVTALRSASGTPGLSRPSSPAIGTSSLLGGASGNAKGTGKLQMNLPGVNDFQNNPVTAITMGLGWLGATVSKGAKEGIDDWVKPGVQKLADSDITTVAQQAAAQINQGIQTGTKTAAEAFNRFVEGDSHVPGETRSGTSKDSSPGWVNSLNAINHNLAQTGQSLWGSLAPALSGPLRVFPGLDQGFHDPPQGRAKGANDVPGLQLGEDALNLEIQSALPDTLAMARAPSPPPPPKPKSKPKSKKADVDFWDEFGVSEGSSRSSSTTRRKPKGQQVEGGGTNRS